MKFLTNTKVVWGKR